MKKGKMAVLKPIVWNDNGYRWPSGNIATSGYTKEHGYGHEEWNGRDDWVWEGWRVFHTQAKGAMYDYARDGRLAIIMTAMNEGKFYAVGVGCNVYKNSRKEADAISEALDLHSYVDRMWRVPSIKKAMKSSKAALKRHWRGHTHVNWRCPQTHFVWLAEPIEIIPNDLIPGSPPRQAIVKMHGSYQAVRQDQALSIVRRALPKDHSVIEWLSTNDFDPLPNRAVRHAPPPKDHVRKSAAPSMAEHVRRYMKEYEIIVSPLHARLQSDFKAHLRRRRIQGIRENITCVDLQYSDAERGTVLVEVKPTEPTTVRFAIRTAMGQLLDYYQKASGDPALLIVIDDEPSQEEIRLALSNGFGVSWRKGREFESVWPNAMDD